MATVHANGIEFRVNRYRTGPEGPRPVIVFVHGLAVDNSGWSFTLGMPLATSADVVTYALRGHGRSQLVPSGYRLRDHADDLVALLDALDITEPVHVVGGSYGGAIGIVAAIAHPERIASLFLIDAQLPTPGWTDLFLGHLERIAEALRGDYSLDQVMQLFDLTSRRKARLLVERGKRLLLATSLLEDLRTEPPVDPADFALVRCPVLAVYGERSEIRNMADQLPTLVPHAEVVLTPGADHKATFLQPGELRTLIRRFVGLPEADGGGDGRVSRPPAGPAAAPTAHRDGGAPLAVTES
ncbi:MAG TPA: alpha/beta hydrolase [Acidimicrobiales bacterium]